MLGAFFYNGFGIRDVEGRNLSLTERAGRGPCTKSTSSWWQPRQSIIQSMFLFFQAHSSGGGFSSLGCSCRGESGCFGLLGTLDVRLHGECRVDLGRRISQVSFIYRLHGGGLRCMYLGFWGGAGAMEGGSA